MGVHDIHNSDVAQAAAKLQNKKKQKKIGFLPLIEPDLSNMLGGVHDPSLPGLNTKKFQYGHALG